MDQEKLELPEITDRDLLKREIMLLWLEEDSNRKEEEWEKEGRIEFDIAYDILTEDASRDIGKELMENPIKVLNELKAELVVLKQIETILMHNEHAEVSDLSSWRLQHRKDMKVVLHQIKEHNHNSLEKFKNDPVALEQEIKNTFI